jgi:thymidylate kinase
MSSFVEGAGDAGEPHVPKIVITGGPCSGKTTGMTMLQSTLKGLGYRVYIAPEAATMYFLAGIEFGDLGNPMLSSMFQKTIINAQVFCENSLDRYARTTGEKSVILCDRGTMDGRAYMDAAAFDEVIHCMPCMCTVL